MGTITSQCILLLQPSVSPRLLLFFLFCELSAIETLYAETLSFSFPVLWTGTVGSLVAGLFTSLGALLIFVRPSWSRRAQVQMLAFAAGIMLAASLFSLLLPAFEITLEQRGEFGRAIVEVAGGTTFGALVIWLLNSWIPHEHFIKGPEGRARFDLGRHWLFIVAITLHNFPEGMSVGVAFGGGVEQGIPVMLGIGIQNLPEGLAVAAALIADGFPRSRAFFIATLTGLVEPVGGFIGAFAVSFSGILLPLGLSFAGGAMLFVIFAEIVPETHGKRASSRGLATLSLLVGFVLMSALDLAFG